MFLLRFLIQRINAKSSCPFLGANLACLFLGDAVDCKANKYQLARLQFGLERYRE